MSAPSCRTEGLSVLVVDDEELACRNLRRKLLSVGGVGSVETTTDPLDAVVRLRASPPDLVLLDVHMPQGSRGSICWRTSPRPSGPSPAWPWTAFDEHAARAFEAAALDYLIQPVDPARLAATLGWCAGTWRARLEVPAGVSHLARGPAPRGSPRGSTGSWCERARGGGAARRRGAAVERGAPRGRLHGAPLVDRARRVARRALGAARSSALPPLPPGAHRAALGRHRGRSRSGAAHLGAPRAAVTAVPRGAHRGPAPATLSGSRELEGQMLLAVAT